MKAMVSLIFPQLFVSAESCWSPTSFASIVIADMGFEKHKHLTFVVGAGVIMYS